MGFSTTNSKGIKLWLHKILTKNGRYLYFFSKKEEGSIDLPDKYEVVESPRSGHLFVRRKKLL